MKMFRKVTKKPKAIQATSLRRLPLDDNDDDITDHANHADEDAQNGPENDSTTILQRIQETQKKHKLLASLPIASGDAKPKKRRFLATTLMDEGNTNEEEDPSNHDLTVLALKHKQAMNEYIRGKLNTTTDHNHPISSTDDNDDDGRQQQYQQPSSSSVDPETLLYRELAAAAVPSQVLAQNHEDDAKGAAILVGGTGIAEVILPKTSSSKLDNPTAPMGLRYSRNPNVSSAVANLKDQRMDSSITKNLLPAGFRSMVPDKVSHDELPAMTTTMTTPTPSRSTNNSTSTTAVDGSVNTPAVDDSRPGFASLVKHHHSNYHHGKTTRPGSSSATNGTAPSSSFSSKPRGHQYVKDQQAFSKFVKRQRESGGRR